jgi:hypothetical protein
MGRGVQHCFHVLAAIVSHQEFCLCIAACEAMRKNDQRVFVGWRSCGGFPNGNIAAGDG